RRRAGRARPRSSSCPRRPCRSRRPAGDRAEREACAGRGSAPGWPGGPSAAEADAATRVGGADLDVRDLVDRHAVLAPAAIGEPEGAAGGEGGVDVLTHGVSVGVVGEHDLELLRRVLDPDADVHVYLHVSSGGHRRGRSTGSPTPAPSTALWSVLSSVLLPV